MIFPFEHSECRAGGYSPSGRLQPEASNVTRGDADEPPGLRSRFLGIARRVEQQIFGERGVNRIRARWFSRARLRPQALSRAT